MTTRRSMGSLLFPLILMCAVAAPALAAKAGGAESEAAAGLDKARGALRSQNWQEAAELLRSMTKENPYKGAFFYYLGSAEYSLENWQASADAYLQAAELGFQTGGSLYNRGCSLALDGQGEAAIEAIEQAIRNDLANREELLRTDSDLDSIRDTALFRQRILPAIDPELPRTERWRVDIDYLTRRMEETHWDVYQHISREEWAAECDRLVDQSAELEDYEIVVDLMKLVTRVNDGHTSVRPLVGGDNGFHVFPVRFYVFADGIYVRDALEDYRHVVGKRVIRVGNLPVEEAFERAVLVTQRDNTQQIKWIAPRYMSVAEVLHRLGVNDNLNTLDVIVADKDGRQETVRVESTLLTREMMGWQYDGQVTMADDSETPVPLWRRDLYNNYWFEYLAEEKLVYFHFNSVRDQDGIASIADFSSELFEFIDKNDVDALVIDVRLNHGGNNYLVKPIIDRVVASGKINRRGHLFVVIGRETFSACQNFCNRLEREAAGVLFVGEPTGSRPNFVGEGNPIELPYSGLTVNGSSRYWQDSVSEDQRMWIAPDLVAEMTSEDFRTNRDPALAVIRQYLANRADAPERASR